MRRPRLIVWGAGGHSLVVADIIVLRAEYELVGFLDDVNTGQEPGHLYGRPVFRGLECLDDLRRERLTHVIIGFGDCEARLRSAELARMRGFSLATAVHPQAAVARDVAIGEGTVIAAGAVVNPGSTIGENVNIAPGASVDHQCTVEDGAHLSPGVRLSSTVEIGRAAWVGIGATVVEGVRVGAGSLVGAGALVLDHVPDGCVAYGVPAVIVRTASDGAYGEVRRWRAARAAREGRE